MQCWILSCHAVVTCNGLDMITPLHDDWLTFPMINLVTLPTYSLSGNVLKSFITSCGDRNNGLSTNVLESLKIPEDWMVDKISP